MSLLLLLRSQAAVVTPPAAATVNPVPTIEIDFQGNPTASYADIQTNEDGVVSFWRMNSSSFFADERSSLAPQGGGPVSAGGAHAGVIVGTPTTTASPYPYDADLALAFDGSSDGAYVLSATDLANKSNMTIEGWLRIDSLPAGTRDVVAKRGAWLLQLTSTGKLIWTLKDDNSTATLTSNSTFVANTWYHVAGVYNSQTISLYVTGVLDNSTAYTAGWSSYGNPIRFAQTMSATSPVWQSSQTATGVGTVITVAKPVSTAGGDLLVAFIGWGQHDDIVSVPNGWTLAATVGIDTGIGSHSKLYWKIAGASEPASYTWNIGVCCPTWSASVTRITGADTTQPFSDPVWSLAQNGSTFAIGPHTPSTDNNLILAYFNMESNGGWTGSSGTERFDVDSALYTQTQSSAAQITFTGTSSTTREGTGMLVFVTGGAANYAAVSLDDWSFSTVARTASDIARDYASRTSGVGTWSDISTSLRSLEITGASRQYELDAMEAGTTTLLLRDSTRTFDPANPSSPYSPHVIPMRRVRGRTTYQGTTYDLFFDYIERWPTQDPAPGYQEVSLTAVDGFDALALAQVSGSLEVGYSGTQIGALLDKALWPRSARNLDRGQYVMAAQTLSSTAALGAIQEIANSERGIFYIDQSGIATFHDSAHRGSFSRSTTSQATFVDSSAVPGIVYQGYAPSYDKDKVINEWTVSPDSSIFQSAAQIQQDADSIAEFWKRSNSRSTRLASNADALAQAGNLLNETSQPGLRFDTITVVGKTVTAYQTCLNLNISDRVTVVRGSTQKWQGALITKDCFIEARRISIPASEPWVFTFALSPVSLGNYRGTIVRDGPVSYWRMDAVS